jgi:hypothetical protein
MTSVSCPVSNEKLNENHARIVAGLVFINTTVALVTGAWWLLLLQGIDFTIRAANKREYSPFRFVAVRLGNWFGVGYKATDVAPKRFAAGVGVFFSFTIGALLLFHQPYAAYGVGAVLLVCAFLESVFAYCVGCVVYHFGVKISLIPA